MPWEYNSSYISNIQRRLIMEVISGTIEYNNNIRDTEMKEIPRIAGQFAGHFFNVYKLKTQ